MLRCYITDRRRLPPAVTLMDSIARNLVAGVDWIQLREKDLSARELFELTARILAQPNPANTKLLVNTRVDVALAAGAAGCHLPANSPPPLHWRKLAPAGFLLGTSCHTVDEVQAAEGNGADYALFAPVFPPRSKTSDLPARGLNELALAARSVRIPVLALGGITSENALSCLEAGAAGIAAVSLFQEVLAAR